MAPVVIEDPRGRAGGISREKSQNAGDPEGSGNVSAKLGTWGRV